MSPPEGIHTQWSALASTCHLQQGENKTLSTQLYTARLTRQEERKDSKDMQGYLADGFIVSAGSITKRVSLYSVFISSALVHLLTILCKHLCYFQAGGKQSEFLFPFHLSSFSSYYDAKHETSRTGFPGDSRINTPAGYPENTRPACTPGTSMTNPSLSCPGCLGPRPNWDSKPPPLSPRLSAVQGPPPPKNKTQTVGPKRAGSTTREQQVFQAPIPKYVLGTIYL